MCQSYTIVPIQNYQIFPTETKWLVNLASCVLAKGGDGAITKAVELLEKALSIDPKLKEAYEMLADLYSLEG